MTHVPPGWYADGSTPGVVRWFDGTGWTEHTTPVAAAPEPVHAGWSAPSAGSTVTRPTTTPSGAVAGHGGRFAGGGAGSVSFAPAAASSSFSPAVGGRAATFAPAAGGYVAPSFATGPAVDEHGPRSAMHWTLPVGRSWQSIVAGYVGLFALGIWVLGPVAIGFGAWAMVVARRGGHGRGRAVFAIVAGLLASAAGVWVLTSA